MDPEAFRAWQAVLRDLVIFVMGVFMLAYQTIEAAEPNPYIIGAGLLLLGVPPAIRTDERLRRRKENGDGQEDRWSHLP